MFWSFHQNAYFLTFPQSVVNFNPTSDFTAEIAGAPNIINSYFGAATGFALVLGADDTPAPDDPLRVTYTPTAAADFHNWENTKNVAPFSVIGAAATQLPKALNLWAEPSYTLDRLSLTLNGGIVNESYIPGEWTMMVNGLPVPLISVSPDTAIDMLLRRPGGVFAQGDSIELAYTNLTNSLENEWGILPSFTQSFVFPGPPG